MLQVLEILPTAQPAKVRLSPMISEALPLVISWAEKPENAEFFRRFRPICDWLNLQIAAQLFTDLWLVYEDTLCVGLVGLYGHDRFGRTAEVGLLIDNATSVQRSQTARDAGQQACEYGFNYLNLNKICIRLLESRSKLAKRLEDNGFKLEGRLRDSIFFEGKYHTELFYGCLKSEYKRA